MSIGEGSKEFFEKTEGEDEGGEEDVEEL